MDDLWQITDRVDHDDVIDLEIDHKHRLRLAAYGKRLFRIWLQFDGTSLVDRSWSIASEDPSLRINPPETGYARNNPAGRKPIALIQDGQWLSTGQVRVSWQTKPFALIWQRHSSGGWRQFLADRPTGAYRKGSKTGQIHHFQKHAEGDSCWGLGEKAGPLERTGKEYEFNCLDALGYDAAETDPLYKHWPFLIVHTAAGDNVGIFWDNLAQTRINLGRQRDNYHQPYRSYQASQGDLDYWVLLEDDPQALTSAFVQLIGGTCYPPTWSLGYSGSTMHYTDAENAAEQLAGFLDLLETNDIACDSFQLSSGYTTIGSKRYVFNWDRTKISDPAALTAKFKAAGIHLAANIKPFLLQDHPQYQACKELMVQVDGQPEKTLLWDDWGSALDFTNPQTRKWWYQNVQEQLLAYGIQATWNDNNEFEIWDESAICHGFGHPLPASAIRPLNTLLMVQSSARAQYDFAPGKRQYLITRSAAPGIQRWAETWSGDNYSSWKTLKYNTLMGLGMSMSGMYRIGHDVGGFAGNKPSPELFVRWVQNGSMHPRFTIHSWHDDGSVNEPWMYPQYLGLIRETIANRYRLMPYFATLAWLAHTKNEPIIKPLFYGYPNDPDAWRQTTDFLLGDELLVASVVEEGERSHHSYLPVGGYGWYQFDRDQPQWFAPGESVDLDAPLERLPILVRAGGAVPIGQAVGPNVKTADEIRKLLIFPAPGKANTCGVVYADDGITNAWRKGCYHKVDWEMTTTNDEIMVELVTSGSWQPPYRQIEVVTPDWETRKVIVKRRFVSH